MTIGGDNLAASARSGSGPELEGEDSTGPASIEARLLSDPEWMGTRPRREAAPTPRYERPPDTAADPPADGGATAPSSAMDVDLGQLDVDDALEEPGEDGAPTERSRWFDEPRRYPHSQVDAAAVRHAVMEAEEQSVAASRQLAATIGGSLVPSHRWRLVGPGNFAGRVTAIAVDPRNSNRLLVCTSSGGVWRSTNSGETWQEARGIGANFTGAVTVDPNASARVYVGTGDKDIWKVGTGLYVSSDFGRSFTRTGLTAVAWIATIHVRTGNWRTVVVASDRGIHRSTNGATTFTRTFSGGAVDDLCVNPSNQNQMWIGVRGVGVFRSTNGGQTWAPDTGPGPGNDSAGSPIAFGRVRVAMCSGSPGELYASYDVAGSVQMWRRRGSSGAWTRLSAVPDAGWGQLWYNHYVAVHPTNPDIVYSGQGTIYRSNFGGRRIFGVSTWQEISSGGGDAFVTIHADQHCLTFDPANLSTIYAGCDGGVYRSTIGGTSWSYLGAAIPTSEFYALGVGTADPYQVAGGTQDNGTWTTDGAYNRWLHGLGGDGFEVLVDPTDNRRVYAETQRLRVYRSEARGAPGTFATKIAGIHPGDVRPWYARLTLAPTRPSDLYVGADKVYKSTNRADSWTATSCGDFVSLVSDRATSAAASPPVTSLLAVDTTSTAAAALGLSGASNTGGEGKNARLVTRRGPFALTDGSRLDLRVDGGTRQRVTFRADAFADISQATPREVSAAIRGAVSGVTAAPSTGNPVTALEVAPTTSAAVYAASTADFYRSVNSGRDWTRLGSGLPNRWISDIAVSSRWYRLALTVSGSGTPHVWYSANGGATWAARSGGLPDAPASSIVIDPDDERRWWVATDVGVYMTVDAGVTWSIYNTGIPQVVVTDLDLHRTTGLLRAATYGRGIWERQATDLRLWFRGLRTASNVASNARTFRLRFDALALTMDLSATQDLLNLGLTYDAMFQIIDPKTNQARSTTWSRNLRFQHGQAWWISRGTNWGSSSEWTTPERWGLIPGVWVFRASLTVNGGEPFAVADDHVFQVLP